MPSNVRYATSSLAAAAYLAALGLVAPSLAHAECTLGNVRVLGRVVDMTSGLPDPVACCDIEVAVDDFDMGTDPLLAHGRTRADGTFDICAPCPTSPTAGVQVSAQALCCGGTSPAFTLDSCVDSTTGLPATVDLGDMACLNVPLVDRTALQGSVVCRSGALLEAVADCGILLGDLNGDGNAPDAFTRTNASGHWELCVPCPTLPLQPTVTAQCCGETETIALSGCPEVQTVAPFVCDPCPVPPCADGQDVEVSGRVLCSTPGNPPEPLADCQVLVVVRDGCTGEVLETRDVVTAADGTYKTCLPCPASEACPRWSIDTEPACCTTAGRRDFVDGCPPSVQLPDNVCTDLTSCGMPPGCPTGETVLRGRVTCLDLVGNTVPIAGCAVLIAPVSPMGCPVTPFTVVTDANGEYTTCVPCPACPAVTVTALCCGANVIRNLSCSNVNVADISCGDCAPDDCVGAFAEVHGRVTCPDPAGGVMGVADCTVVLECPGQPPVTAVTDANGFYAACVPCPGCDVITITATCCNTVRTALVPLDCSALEIDLACNECPGGTTRPCSMPDGVLVSGQVLCTSGAGAPGTPLAGCVVELIGIDSAGTQLTTVTAVTGGDGRYEACVPCGATGLSSVIAVASCCSASTTTAVTGCPETAALETITCTECTPCPPGMTRLQGRVRCSGGGPMRACEVVVTVETCTGTQTFTATSDAQGKYRLCIPCPCTGGRIRVTALCCPSTRVIEPDTCGPVTPVPTLFCRTPC